MKIKIAPYSKYIKLIENEDANKVYKKILDLIPADEWSIWFLDPFSHDQLKWKTIEAIASHTSMDHISRCRRKPELIINLATLSMQRTLDNKNEINEALGVADSKVWEDEIKKGKKCYDVFRDIFLKKLEEQGYKYVYFSIEQTKPNTSHLYYIIFASSVPKVQEILMKNFEPYIKRIQKEKWAKENYKFRLIDQAQKQNISPLSNWN